MDHVNWNSLKRLRTLFLDDKPSSRQKNYWDTEELLHLYDQTFAQRIDWKWQYVLETWMDHIGDIPDGVKILDWGCGTAIASRAFLSAFPSLEEKAQVYLFDRSQKATQFALKKLKEEFPQARCTEGFDASLFGEEKPFILLLSHVLNELDKTTLGQLEPLMEKADWIFWVEPGTYDISRALVSMREKLMLTHKVLAPCPHQTPCPLWLEKNQKHWCHTFSSPPQSVYHSSFWSQFSKQLKIDIRSLPTSFLILSKTKEAGSEKPFPLGRWKQTKTKIEGLACTKDGTIEKATFQPS